VKGRSGAMVRASIDGFFKSWITIPAGRTTSSSAFHRTDKLVLFNMYPYWPPFCKPNPYSALSRLTTTHP
jgi:hypothetical protein